MSKAARLRQSRESDARRAEREELKKLLPRLGAKRRAFINRSKYIPASL